LAIAIFLAASISATTGCAAVLGLDSGNDVADFGDAEAGADPTHEDAGADAEVTPEKDSGPALTCMPGTANCDGNSANGCETMTNTAQHCGSCTTACAVFQTCMANTCCNAMNVTCSVDGDCCSGKCNNRKCNGP
jgi:hypothetical protein